jgi:hypothetical protein
MDVDLAQHEQQRPQGGRRGLPWDRCRAWLLPALLPQDGSETQLLEAIITGQAQLWVGERCAMVTQCVPEPAGLCIHAWLAGGDLEEIKAMVPGIEAWARAAGCDYATITGRTGWLRALQPQGYSVAGSELKKDLADPNQRGA